MPANHARIICEIRCAGAALAGTLARIVAACAHDTGQAVDLRLVTASTGKPAITLSLPVELAAAQHPVWCLACRLACFCPAARVSVLILGADALAPPPEPSQRRRSA